MSDKCAWIHYDEDDNVWVSECGLEWVFPEPLSPQENGMNFCPGCGLPLKSLGSRRRNRLLSLLGIRP